MAKTIRGVSGRARRNLTRKAREIAERLSAEYDRERAAYKLPPPPKRLEDLGPLTLLPQGVIKGEKD